MKMSGQVIQRWSKAKNPEILRSRAQNRAGPPKLAQSKGLGANLAFFSVENHPVLAFFISNGWQWPWEEFPLHSSSYFRFRTEFGPDFGPKTSFFLKKPCLNKLQTSPTRPKCILTDLRGYRVPFLTISIQNPSTQRRWAANNMPKKLIFCPKITI